MTNNDSTIEVLNDLIQINNDRIVGYDNAIENLKDGDDALKVLFARLIQNSTENIHELTRSVNEHDGEPVTDTTVLGKVYRAWMDVKSAFTGHDREGVINDCKGGEKAAEVAYEKALNDPEELSAETQTLILKQQTVLMRDRQLVDSLN
jgi:uncharacterized protein (TIGR02284 family)